MSVIAHNNLYSITNSARNNVTALLFPRFLAHQNLDVLELSSIVVPEPCFAFFAIIITKKTIILILCALFIDIKK